jgi:hypothetical protein
MSWTSVSSCKYDKEDDERLGGFKASFKKKNLFMGRSRALSSFISFRVLEFSVSV